MEPKEVFNYYSREDVISAIISEAKDREVAFAYSDGHYDKRPNMLQFSGDMKAAINKGITSFHFSVERWKNPMLLSKENYNELRSGWDLLIDMDSKIGMNGSIICAREICNFLEKYGIKNYGLKFSGSRGFHIIVPWESFPKEINYTPLEKTYPDSLRTVISFIREKISEDLMKAFVKEPVAKELIEASENIDPFYIVDVEKGWGARHMFRAPYSLNEKTWLVSCPIERHDLNNFDINKYKIDTVKIKDKFIKGKENEAEKLLIDALDWSTSQNKEIKTEKKIIAIEGKIPEEMFPPCIKIILNGMNDGKKRSLFTIISFLRLMNWTQEEIEDKLMKWNEKNTEKLSTSLIKTQIIWNIQNQRTTPNCSSEQYIKSIGICHPDNNCSGIKNPLSYPFRVMKKEKKDNLKKNFVSKNYFCFCNESFENQSKLDNHKSRKHGGID